MEVDSVPRSMITYMTDNDANDDNRAVGKWDHAHFIYDSVMDDDEANRDGHACNVSSSGQSVRQKQAPVRLKECYI